MSSAETRVVAVPTVTRLGPETVGAVVVGGSHAAVYTAYLTVKAGARAAIQHDAGIGREQAGIGGLAWAEQFGFAMAAVAARTARIGDGADMLSRGVISSVNRLAAKCNVVPGMSCRQAAELLCAAAEPTSRPAPLSETRSELLLEPGTRAIVLVDSIALAQEKDRAGVVVSGSHGGIPSDGYAARIGMKLVLFNDASFCAEYSGIAALDILDEKGIAALAVSAFTARIGDGRSTYADGIISAANRRATALGARIGAAAKDLVREASGQ